MKIKNLLIAYCGLSAVIMGCLLVLAMTMLKNNQALTESAENRYNSYLRADELRQSSDDLTRLARTYVVLPASW